MATARAVYSVVYLIVVTLLFAPYSYGAIEDGLIHVYNMTIIGGAVKDQVGNDDLTVSGALADTATCGPRGDNNACSFFDGVNDYMSRAHSNSFLTSEGFTICAWITLSDDTNAIMKVIGQQGTAAYDNFEMTIRNGADDYLEGYTYENAAQSYSTVSILPASLSNHRLYCIGNRDLATDKVFTTYRSTIDDDDGDNAHAREVPDTAYTCVGVRANSATGCSSTTDVFEGYIDEIYIWNKGLSTAALAKLNNQTVYYNKTSGTFMNYNISTAPDTLAPAITLKFPVNNSHYNIYNGTLSFTVFDLDTVTCDINDTRFIYNKTVGTTLQYRFISPVNDYYDIRFNCSDTSHNMNYTRVRFVYDTVKPLMHSFTPANNSITSKNTTNHIYLNFTVQDLYLYRVNATVTRVSDGLEIYNNYSGNLPGIEWYNVSQYINVTNLSTGEYKVKVDAVDVHTTKEFKETPSIKIIDGGKGDTKKTETWELKHATVNFTTYKSMTIKSEKLADRITQTFDISKFPERAEYSISAAHIDYLPYSEYPCHLIIDGKYWYDCAGLEEPLVSEVKRNKEYKIKFRTEGKKEVTTHSLGGLNVLNYTSYFNINEAGPAITTLIIKVRDTATGFLLNQNVSVTISNPGYSLTTTINNGSYTNTTIPAGAYSAVLSSSGFTTANYNFNLMFNATTTLNAFLTNSTTSVIFTVQDSDTARALEGAAIAISGLINGSMVLLGTYSSDITGRIRFNYVPLSPYEFVVIKSGYETKSFTLNPVIFDSYYINMERSSSGATGGGLTDLSISITPQRFAVGHQNLSIYLLSPSGELEYYIFNATWPGNYTDKSGANAYGTRSVLPVHIVAASFGDTLELEIKFKKLNYSEVVLKYNYPIEASPSNWTLAAEGNKTYGLGLVERLLIVVLAVLIFAGAATYYGGAPAGVTIAMLFFGYFAYIGFISGWFIFVPIMAGLFMLLGRSD